MITTRYRPTVRPRKPGERKGWAEALEPARQPLVAAYSDVILYDAAGRRIGVMDRVTRERKLDRDADS